MKFVLLLFFYTGPGVSSETIEFDSAEACIRAKEAIRLELRMGEKELRLLCINTTNGDPILVKED